MTIKISVVVPLFNGERFIERTLDSVADQTAVETGDVDLEVIIVDDGSTDGGPELAKAHRVAPVSLSQDHLGVAVARNRGALAATGQWLTFLDQDDLWHRRRLEYLIGHLLNEDHSLVATTETKFAYSTEKRDLYHNEPDLAPLVNIWIQPGEDHMLADGPLTTWLEADINASEAFDSAVLMSRTITMSTSFFIKRDFLFVVGGWSPHAASIDDWWLMVNASRIEPIVRVNQPTVLYRLHSAATSRSTKFLYPYTSSLLALRFGGMLESRAVALHFPSSSGTARHLVLSWLRSDEFLTDWSTLRFVWHISHLLWPGERWGLVFFRAAVRRALGWAFRHR